MATWKKIITSGSAAELSSLTLDTALPVAQGGTGATTLTADGVLFGNGTSAISAVDLSSNGHIIVGGASPAAEDGDDLAGTGLAATKGNGTLVINVEAAQTGITSIKHNSLLIGGNSQNNTIDFGTDDTILFDIDNTEVARVDAAGVDITGVLTLTSHISSSGDVSASAFYGDGSNLTGVSQDIDSLTELDATPHQTEDEFLISDDGTEKRISMANVAKGVFAAADDGDDATIAADGGITINDDAVTNAKLANMTQGTIKVGGSGNAPTDLDANDDGKILVGDGTDINSVAVSGDVTLANNGAVTIANDAVDNNKLANIARGSIKVGGGSNAPTDLDAKGDGKILVGDGTDINSVAVSGDISLANNGAVTIANNTIGNDELKQDEDITLQKLTLTGDLIVNGTTTTISSSTLTIQDAFMFTATGSAAANVDAGFMVQSGSVDRSGSAFYHDISSQRWAVAKNLGHDTIAVPDAKQSGFVVTVTNTTATPGPNDGEYGIGEMWVDNDLDDGAGNGTIFIRTA